MTNSRASKQNKQPARLRIGLVVPHIFMQNRLLPKVIFSPGRLALELADVLERQDVSVTLFTPGPVTTKAKNVTADLSYFERELAAREDGYLDLLKKHPLTFISLARQVQAEIIAKAYAMANAGLLDVVHIYTNEEDIALPFAKLCRKPVVLTHHDPFNFLIAYRNVFPKYKDLNWVSISFSQRADMPKDTNWVGNVYHGLDPEAIAPNYEVIGSYVAYLGRIIEPKGVHLAIGAVRRYNKSHKKKLQLKIAGKHYAGHKKDSYWQQYIEPEIDGNEIAYVGFLDGASKAEFLRNAQALMMPSLFAEPFGMVAIESLAAGTPVIGLDSGAIPEVIKDGVAGYVVPKMYLPDGRKLDEEAAVKALAEKLLDISKLDRRACRTDFEARFSVERMCADYARIYASLSDTHAS